MLGSGSQQDCSTLLGKHRVAFYSRSLPLRVLTREQLDDMLARTGPPVFRTKRVRVGVVLGCYGSEGILAALRRAPGIEVRPVAALTARYISPCKVLILAQPRGRGTLSWFAKSMLPLLAPTLVMTGLALVVLLVQRDLGTASILLLIYAAVVYLTSGQKSILVIGLLGLALAGALGYMLFDVVQIRIDAWVNPWADPSRGFRHPDRAFPP